MSTNEVHEQKPSLLKQLLVLTIQGKKDLYNFFFFFKFATGIKEITFLFKVLLHKTCAVCSKKGNLGDKGVSTPAKIHAFT